MKDNKLQIHYIRKQASIAMTKNENDEIKIGNTLHENNHLPTTLVMVLCYQPFSYRKPGTWSLKVLHVFF